MLKTGRRFYAVLPSGRSAVNYSRRGEQLGSSLAPIKMVTKTSSGVSVATVDQQGPLSSIALVVHAGSRHESPNALGVAHLWKNSFVRNIPSNPLVQTIRETELRGDSLYTAVTREHLVIASDFLRDDLVDVVSEMVANFNNKSIQAFEFLDTKDQVLNETEFALHDPGVLAMENLHAAAFRKGLGNSLFATGPNVSELKRANLEEFAKKWFSTDRIAIIGKDVNHKDLVKLVEKAFAQYTNSATTSTTAEPSKYYGAGERRVDGGNGSFSEFVVAFPSVAIQSQQYPAALVLTALLDGSRRLKWGPASSGLLAKAVQAVGASSTVDVSVKAFNTSYSDAGLFGVHVSTASAASVKPVVQSSIDILKSVSSSVTEADLTRAKKAAMINLDNSRESGLINLASGFFSSRSVVDASDLSELISKVTTTDVSKMAKYMLSAKPTVSAVGPSTLPYLDEFKF